MERTLVLLPAAQMALGDCSGNDVRCYECNSRTDPRCTDPFNSTALSARCSGCCAKIVSYGSTPNEVIRRTCTSKLVLYSSLVAPGCATQSNGTDEVCYCDGDDCNAAVESGAVGFLLVLVLLLGRLLV